MIKDVYIKYVLITIKNPQSNATGELVNQVILNMLVTKYLDKKIFENIYPWGETLAYIVWKIRASYHCNIMATPVQDVFGKDM